VTMVARSQSRMTAVLWNDSFVCFNRM